jgi:hypothetical protein
MAVRGDDQLKIRQRCVHTTFSTTELYIREAEAVREGFGEVFPTLPISLLGPGESSRAAVLAANYLKLQRGGRDSNPRPPA